MATCLVVDRDRLIFSSTNTSMEKTPPSTSTSAKVADSTTRKRKLSLTESFSNDHDIIEVIIDNSCSSQAVTRKKLHPTVTRPSTLFLNTTPLLRTSVSHPPASSPTCIDNQCLSPSKFLSLPDLFSPSPSKRLRPQSLTLKVNCSSSPSLISPSELAEKLKNSTSLTIFDCGSPFRHSEQRIRNARLLHVSDKISRKRLKTHQEREPTINSKELLDCSMVVLYDDDQPTSIDCLSPALKCACEEIQRDQINGHPPIRILNCSLEHFVDLYPNLCESLQARSCPSSPVNSDKDSSSPQTAPAMSDFSLDHLKNEEEIDRYPMTHILDGLFIGSESNAKNLEQLNAEKIHSIVNVTTHVPLYHNELFQYCHLPADDSQKQNLIDYFEQAYSFIHQALKNHQKVLVHCVAGISRSPAIVIAFLMRYANMTMNDAYQFVKRKRSIVSPNLNFMGQLLEYEKKLKLI